MQTEQTQEISQEAARAMLAALRHLTGVFPDPIIRAGKRLRRHEVATLNGVVIDGQRAIALAERGA